MTATTEETTDPVQNALEAQVGERVLLAHRSYEWSTPMEVVDAPDPIKWDVPFGEDWQTRSVVLETARESQYGVVIDTGDDVPATVNQVDDGEIGHSMSPLATFEPVVEDESGTSIEDDSTELSEAPDVDLEEEAADDAPEDTGDDVQEETPSEGDDQDEPEVKLPGGVTVDDVEAAVADRDRLGDVAADIGVTRGRARTITVALGCYGDVQDLPRNDRAQLTLPGAIVFFAICMLFLGFAYVITNGVTVP